MSMYSGYRRDWVHHSLPTSYLKHIGPCLSWSPWPPHHQHRPQSQVGSHWGCCGALVGAMLMHFGSVGQGLQTPLPSVQTALTLWFPDPPPHKTIHPRPAPHPWELAQPDSAAPDHNQTHLTYPGTLSWLVQGSIGLSLEEKLMSSKREQTHTRLLGGTEESLQSMVNCVLWGPQN